MALTLGLVSSLHCVGMCAPLQAVVLQQWLRHGGRWQAVGYHAGRIATYVLMGLSAAFVGQAVGMPAWQNHFTILAGIALLVGYFLFRALRWDQQFYRLIGPWLMRLQKHLRQRPQSKGLVVLSGSINGLLPCGMVYAALLPAMTAPSLMGSGIFMLFFGLATLPALLAGQWFLARFAGPLRQMGPRLMPYTLLLVGGLLILRGMELGIPFLSPAAPAIGAVADGCINP